MKPEVGDLVDGCISLRLLERDDLPRTLGWRNRDDVRMWFFDSRVIDIETHTAWFDRYENRDDDFVFIVNANDRPVGQVAIYNIDRTTAEGEFGRLLIGEPAVAGRGYAGVAGKLACTFAWTNLGLSRLRCEIKSDNVRSLKACTRAGFVETARRPGVIEMIAHRQDPWRDRK